MDMSTEQQRLTFGEITTPKGRLTRHKKSNTPNERKTPTIGENINGLLKLKILRQKNELFNQMKKQGLISMGSGLTKIMDDCYLKTWNTFVEEGIEGLQVQYKSRCNDDDLTKAFMVALLRDFFLDLDVEKVELLC